MSYSSKAYLSYSERLLEPDILSGTQRRYKELKQPVPVLNPYPELSEYERARREDEWIEQNCKNEQK